MVELSRIVVDTNVLVNRPLLPRSVPAEAVRRAVDGGTLLDRVRLSIPMNAVSCDLFKLLDEL